MKTRDAVWGEGSTVPPMTLPSPHPGHNEVQALINQCIHQVNELMAQFQAQRAAVVAHFGERISDVMMRHSATELTQEMPPVNRADTQI